MKSVVEIWSLIIHSLQNVLVFKIITKNFLTLLNITQGEILVIALMTLGDWAENRHRLHYFAYIVQADIHFCIVLFTWHSKVECAMYP